LAIDFTFTGATARLAAHFPQVRQRGAYRGPRGPSCCRHRNGAFLRPSRPTRRWVRGRLFAQVHPGARRWRQCRPDGYMAILAEEFYSVNPRRNAHDARHGGSVCLPVFCSAARRISASGCSDRFLKTGGAPLAGFLLQRTGAGSANAASPPPGEGRPATTARAGRATTG